MTWLHGMPVMNGLRQAHRDVRSSGVLMLTLYEMPVW